ncbi:hypothetical protein GWO43_02275, partial [candidate division KSB1 bacterium]|nr:hypothetical protein [candidate division KSB1 bacterium]NIR69691.1 hypothetical protein [candidate division KSB1 bacterium]NIS24887.1 hypothetical protein [candidate division KSB1 bacterium]NIT69736.1 hypothetical protein [candidate division KSB1 bacterium]NIU23406.1 hypothetical protein [candidate division KSB1 bacterium]
MRFEITSLILMLLLSSTTILKAQGNRILNLYDAFGKEVTGATFDWGFSALIEYDGKTLL